MMSTWVVYNAAGVIVSEWTCSARTMALQTLPPDHRYLLAAPGVSGRTHKVVQGQIEAKSPAEIEPPLVPPAAASELDRLQARLAALEARLSKTTAPAGPARE